MVKKHSVAGRIRCKFRLVSSKHYVSNLEYWVSNSNKVPQKMCYIRWFTPPTSTIKHGLKLFGGAKISWRWSASRWACNRNSRKCRFHKSLFENARKSCTKVNIGWYSIYSLFNKSVYDLFLKFKGYLVLRCFIWIHNWKATTDSFNH